MGSKYIYVLYGCDTEDVDCPAVTWEEWLRGLPGIKEEDYRFYFKGKQILADAGYIGLVISIHPEDLPFIREAYIFLEYWKPWDDFRQLAGHPGGVHLDHGKIIIYHGD